MTVLEKLLKEYADEFRVITTRTESYELFFVHHRLETVRATDTSETRVTVYVRHDGKLGDSTFSMYESVSEEELAEKIREAVARAALVFNEPYELPEGGEFRAELASDMKNREPRELAAEVADAVFAADCIGGGSVNATEIFLYRDTVRVTNSRGLDKTQVKYRAMIEAIPTFTEGEESVELYEALRFTEFSAADITAEISERLKDAARRCRAIRPETPQTADVVLRSKEISELMFELAGDLSYAGVYSQANLHKKGDSLQTGDCDRLTLTRKGQLTGSDRSSYFDEDGVTLNDTVLIRDGTVTGYYGAHRFASYLGEPETGNLPCMQVETGTLTGKELDRMPYLECVSLSGLQVDLYNDYIGGEIRLAYLHNNGEVLPVTGVTMSAKLSEVLNTLRLSDTAKTLGSYEGPDRLLMRHVKLM